MEVEEEEEEEVGRLGISVWRTWLNRVHIENGLCIELIIIIIAPLTIVSEDQWGELQCLHKACQTARTDGGLLPDTGVDERGENERQSENDYEMKTIS